MREWIESTHPSRHFDPPLTDGGKAQAAVAANALVCTALPFAALYCSPQLRCIETAVPIAAALGLVRVPLCQLAMPIVLSSHGA